MFCLHFFLFKKTPISSDGVNADDIDDDGGGDTNDLVSRPDTHASGCIYVVVGAVE